MTNDDNDEASNFKTPDRKIQIQQMRGVIGTGELAKLVEDGKISKRALLEIRDGKYSNGEPAGPSVFDGFYFVELDDDDRILDGWLYGPYTSAVEAESAARKAVTETELNCILMDLERQGRIRRFVGEDGEVWYEAVEPKKRTSK
jgi:hypothetical protein